MSQTADIASAIRDAKMTHEARADLARNIATILHAHNPAFDRGQFTTACIKPHNAELMTKAEATAAFVALVGEYGLRWTATVPREAYELMSRVNLVLTERDRRAALGLRN